MITTYMGAEELERYTTVTDKELNKSFQEVRAATSGLYYLQEKTTTKKRWLRPDVVTTNYQLFFDLGKGEVQVINFCHDWDWSINSVVPKSYIMTYFIALLAGIGYSMEYQGEKEVMIQAFDKTSKLFEVRSWIMEGRGNYPYDDDKYKEEVRYLYDEFDAVKKETWANIKSKTFEYRQKILSDFIQQIEDRIASLNKQDAEFCKERWDMALPEIQRVIAREFSNQVTFARQVLQEFLPKK